MDILVIQKHRLRRDAIIGFAPIIPTPEGDFQFGVMLVGGGVLRIKQLLPKCIELYKEYYKQWLRINISWSYKNNLGLVNR